MAMMCVSACSDDQRGADDRPATIDNGLAYVHYRPQGDGGDGGLLKATVTDTHGCLTVTGSDGRTWVPVFPIPGSDPAALRIGDVVALGGGHHDTLPNDAVIPDQCRHSGLFWMVYPD